MCAILSVILFLMTLKHFETSVLNPKNVCEDSIVTEIAAKYFDTRNCLSVLRLTKDSSELLSIHFKIPTLVRLINITYLKPNYNLQIRPRRDFFDKKRTINSLCSEKKLGYLIIVNSVSELLKYVYAENITAFWSPQAKIFIYLTEESCNINRTLFDNLWQIYRAPHVVLTGCYCEDILFYNPYLNSLNNSTGNWGKLLNFTKSEVLKHSELIINKMKTFHGYPIKAMVFRSPFSVPKTEKEYVGIDINLLEFIAKKANMTNIVVLPTDSAQYGFKLPNGTYTGALGKLLMGDIDYINVNFFIKDYLTIDIEFSTSVTADNLCVIMRKAERIPDWQLLYFCLDKTTWTAIVTIYFIISFSWMALEKLLTYFHSDAILYPFIMTDTFRLMITSSLFRLPTITSERVFLAMCLMAFVTLVGAFQGSLIGVYSTPMYYTEVETLEDLSRTETKIKSEYMFFIDDVFSDVSYPVIAKLKSMISFYNDTVSITKRVAEQKNFATLVRKSEVQIDNSTTTFYDSHGVNLIHMVKECPRSYNLAYPFPINSAILPMLNMIMLRASEAGLLVKWYDEMAFNVSDSRGNIVGLSDSLKVFSLKDMQISFFQLIIGCLFGIAAFIIEVIIYFLKKDTFPEYQRAANK